MLVEVLLVLITISLAWIGYSLHVYVQRPVQGQQTPRSLISQRATRLAQTWEALAAEAALLAAAKPDDPTLLEATTRVCAQLHDNAPYLGPQALESLLSYRSSVWASARQTPAPKSFAEQAPDIRQLVHPAPIPQPQSDAFRAPPRSDEFAAPRHEAPEPPKKSGGFSGISL
jgi:hypothetical protein